MVGKKIGDPCPKCASTLIARARRLLMRAGGTGDMAYCARCNAAWEAEPISFEAKPERALPA